jgi:hypothetical protein
MKWPISRLAAAYQVSPGAIIDAARIMGKPVFGNIIWFRKRPSPDFFDEAMRAHQARESQAALRRRRMNTDFQT